MRRLSACQSSDVMCKIITAVVGRPRSGVSSVLDWTYGAETMKCALSPEFFASGGGGRAGPKSKMSYNGVTTMPEEGWQTK